MKFFTAATTALLFSAQALAGITQYTLSIQADDERVNGKGITFKHEGAGINYAFVSDTSAKFNYDDESKLFYYPISPQINYNLGTESDIVQFSVTPPKSVEIGDDGILKFEDSDKLYAAVSINDPYHYSDNDFAIILRGKPHAIPIKLVAKQA
ncbi:hypothetical LDG family protein, Candida conserved [Candida dubliniensis CD36]|uniref:Hypothetical LDG family protein, Candida conserved n=1 Tax=Candida dubliniensis (strain CD36 / ATCC MYA-646 / CBS 7987 / NCPF 3949 / NRRL Y-17841) TaxID=573826 RepID=B9WKA8_CANDC|nr:hypothetical LDG family protein, Candida conserved [Candida dubliniensis CD36]CAX40760.1 hypothetical LDG family protein, Candida conserved [Candida dubliniensis CD36]